MRRLAWITGGVALLGLVLVTLGRGHDEDEPEHTRPGTDSATNTAKTAFRTANWDIAAKAKPTAVRPRAPAPAMTRLHGVEVVGPARAPEKHAEDGR